MKSQLMTQLGLSLIVLALAGCKIVIHRPENGKVATVSGAYGCVPSRYTFPCIIDVYDLYFDEEFIAVPDPGYKFSGWRKMERGLCGGKETSCKISSGIAEDNEVLMELLESNEEFYLEPIFEQISACRGSDSGNSKNIVLQQGEFAVREIQVPYIKSNISPRTRLEGCPAGMCSTDVNWDKSVYNQSGSNVTVLDLKFATTSATPTGSYKIQFVSYKSRRRCSSIFGTDCKDLPDKILKRWKFKLRVVECIESMDK